MAEFLVASIVLSVVLTVALNVALRAFPGAGRKISEQLQRLLEERDPSPPQPRRSGVRVVFPWKAMLIVSIMLTILLNLLSAVW